jgi:N-hydroxyarylamine O-acetyltransferase
MLNPGQLTAYLHRAGFDTVPGKGLQGLAALACAHAQAIAFENIDAYIGRQVSLALHDVVAKLVHAGRGGWCFEQNLLLGAALRAMGFDVTDLAGRVLWGRSVDAVTPRTHRALRVRLAGGDWLVDVGFGGQTICGALDMAHADPQQVGDDWFRLARLDGERLLAVRIRGEWLPMYRFDLQAQLPVDFEAANFQLCMDPASHFTQGLALSRAAHDGRHALRGMELAFHDRDGGTTRRTLRGSAETLEVISDVFGIRLDAATRQHLAQKLDAQAGTASRS